MRLSPTRSNDAAGFAPGGVLRLNAAAWVGFDKPGERRTAISEISRRPAKAS
jgi:hypothetical protein